MIYTTEHPGGIVTLVATGITAYTDLCQALEVIDEVDGIDGVFDLATGFCSAQARVILASYTCHHETSEITIERIDP